jgi:signal transduction histidine kinase/ActR/RegA family two-component response regulator
VKAWSGRLGLRGKVVLASGAAVLAAVIATATVAGYFFVERQVTAQSSRAEAIADALAIQLERILALGISLQELQGFDEQCQEAVRRHGQLSYALVVDLRGEILFRSGTLTDPAPALPPAERLDAHAQPLVASDGATRLAVAPAHNDQGVAVARVVVGFSRDAVLVERNALMLRIVGVGLAVMALVLGILAIGLQQMVVRPLTRIVRAMDGIRRGEQDYSVRLASRGDDEIAILREGFNGLVQTVAQREQDLLAAKDSAEQATRAKSQFLAVMSHELRTPLNAVLGMAELLANTRLDERQRRFVSQIRDSGRDLVEIVNDVLDLSHLEAGKLRPVRQPFRLREAVRGTVELYRDLASARELSLSMHVDDSLPDTVLGDVVHVRQVLANLLSNAVKFTERGSVIVRVTPSAGYVRFSVSDTGIGVSPDFMPHLYEAFRQADSAPTRRFGGAGLGLAIARRLCVAMGGRIDASSRPGKGSTFWFELPLPATEGGAEPAGPGPGVASAARAQAANEPLPSATSSTALQVLLIEDDVPNQRLVLDTLAVHTKHEVTLAGDGHLALRWVRRRPFDIVLLDWQLPGVNGLAVLAALREAEASQGWPRTRVIAVTAHTGPGDRETCLAAGADDYLGKPYTPAELIARMASAAAASHPPPL